MAARGCFTGLYSYMSLGLFFAMFGPACGHGSCFFSLRRVHFEKGYKIAIPTSVDQHQHEFVKTLLHFEALRFGSFTLKSGRVSPYFMNAGQLRTGVAMNAVGAAYANAIRQARLRPDLVFGPAYKGVPLAVATAMAWSKDGQDLPYCFDRKEAKDHGEGGSFVGTPPSDGQRVVLVDDVITSGISIRESVAKLQAAAKVEIAGVVVAVDRQEKTDGATKSSVQALRDELGVPVCSIVTIRDIVEILAQDPSSQVMNADTQKAISEYLERYGAAQ